MKIAGKVCVVTGAGSGIGKALAERFAAEGAQGVVCADLNEGNAKAVAAGVNGLAVRCDVSSEADLKDLAASTCSAPMRASSSAPGWRRPRSSGGGPWMST
jgi:NAD(P)-dependent dehydrogenase (short-subunit alcohol dehydrogenase family)